MELVSGFLLWLADIAGVKWVRQEENRFRKVVKAITFLVVGIVVVMLFVILLY